MKRKYIKKKINAAILDDNRIEVFMNTWANYNEYGVDSGITPTGWMSIDDALEYCEKYAEYEPFINDTDIPYEGISKDINEYSNAYSTLLMLQRFNQLDESDKNMINAYFETEGSDFEDALDAVEDRNYIFIEGDTEEDLGYNVLELSGGEIPGDLAAEYFDYDAFGRELEYDFEETDDGYVDENGWVINAFTPAELAQEYIAEIYGYEIPVSLAKDFFDYEAYGRELTFEGYSKCSGGYVYWIN